MTRIEKIEYLQSNGIEISRKANSKCVDKKYDEFKVQEKKESDDAAEKARRQLKNRRRNQRKKNEKIKAAKLKEPNVRYTRKKECFACKKVYKRSETIHERIIIREGKEEKNARFCMYCHKEIGKRYLNAGE